MIRIGILGDIGSGKSYIAQNFGYPVFNADYEVTQLYQKDKNIFHLPFPYPWVLEKQKKTPEEFLLDSLKKFKIKFDLSKDICGVMLETFQGWGALFYPKSYIKLLNKICKKI